MFYEEKAKRSLAARSELIAIYDEMHATLKLQASTLFKLRKDAVVLLNSIESSLKSIANIPISFDKHLTDISTSKRNFNETLLNINVHTTAVQNAELFNSIAKASSPLIKECAPDIAMWVTTFGKASTGKAISELSGIARTNAQLAILGGGAKRIGGKGIEGGKAFLAIVGPLAEVSILGISTATIVFIRCRENIQLSKRADGEAENIRHATSQLVSSIKKIKLLIMQTKEQLDTCTQLLAYVTEHPEFSASSHENSQNLEHLVNSSQKLATLINQTV